MENFDAKELAAQLRDGKTTIAKDGDIITADVERIVAPVIVKVTPPPMEQLDDMIARTQSDLDDLLLIKAACAK